MPTIKQFIETLEEVLETREELSPDSEISFTFGNPKERLELVIADVAGAIVEGGKPEENDLIFSLVFTEQAKEVFLKGLTRSIMAQPNEEQSDG